MALSSTTVPVYLKLGHEFMPPLNEGTILYMPTTLPGISVTEAQRLLQTQDRILKSFPEGRRVFGKAGRAETSTDPAPFSMMETTVVLKPTSSGGTSTGGIPTGRRSCCRRSCCGTSGPTASPGTNLIAEMDPALQIPGMTNAWTMPIKARIDMLTTGVRTPVGIKIFGADLNEIERDRRRARRDSAHVPGTRSVFAERAAGGYFLDFTSTRDAGPLRPDDRARCRT